MKHPVLEELLSKFKAHFGTAPMIAARAPGRVEVLGNHTDYNEGFVLSAAINHATYFMAAPSAGPSCRVVAGDLMQEAAFDVASPQRMESNGWANYVIGVFAGLSKRSSIKHGFNGMFLSNVPLAAGLSSSAALEVSTALALGGLYGIEEPRMEVARICQKAEHEYAGVRCGLLDQISSLFGKADHLVMSDFRTLNITNAPLDPGASLVICNTGVKHTLVESEYNERRASCEGAAAFFKSAIDRPVTALRDVTLDDWERLSSQMDPRQSKRSAHIIGENTRVLKGRKLLASGRLLEFGDLMYESHESSRVYFENSCPELDFIVDTAKKLPEVMGARLSGGGFGGSAVLLADVKGAEKAADTVARKYSEHFGKPCEARVVRCGDGASIVVP